MMKFILSIFLDWMVLGIVLLVLVVVALAHGWQHWYVAPAPNGKWRSCLTEFKWDGGSTSCSSPMSHDEAQWWTDTKSGTQVK
jgi:hypothetical protein